MNIRNSSKTILCGLLLLGGVPLRAEALDEQYRQAAERLAQSHEQRVQQILGAYRQHLDSLIAGAQPRGDIESIVVYLDEKANPGEGAADTRIRGIRAILTEQLQRLESGQNQEQLQLETQYVRGLELRLAEALRNTDDERVHHIEERLGMARRRLAELTPPSESDAEPSSPPASPPDRRLGPDLIPDGNFEDGGEDWWSVQIRPNTRNRSGFVSDSGIRGDRNRVLRVQQDERHTILVQRRVGLTEGTRYEISWRSRLSRDWRFGIELRGYGTYDMGFRIAHNTFERLPDDVQKSIRDHQRGHTLRKINPPRDSEWVTHTVNLTAYAHMDMLEIRINPGEGEWLIDDISIRAILPREP